jgi:hypothetical protein
MSTPPPRGVFYGLLEPHSFVNKFWKKILFVSRGVALFLFIDVIQKKFWKKFS